MQTYVLGSKGGEHSSEREESDGKDMVDAAGEGGKEERMRALVERVEADGWGGWVFHAEGAVCDVCSEACAEYDSGMGEGLMPHVFRWGPGGEDYDVCTDTCEACTGELVSRSGAARAELARFFGEWLYQWSCMAGCRKTLDAWLMGGMDAFLQKADFEEVVASVRAHFVAEGSFESVWRGMAGGDWEKKREWALAAVWERAANSGRVELKACKKG